MKKDDIEKLLAWLHSDRNLAIEQYQSIYRALVQFFECRGCREPAEMADETVARVIKILPEITERHTGNPERFFYAVARRVYQDRLGRPAASNFSGGNGWS
jgi:hypothetical protein